MEALKELLWGNGASQLGENAAPWGERERAPEGMRAIWPREIGARGKMEPICHL